MVKMVLQITRYLLIFTFICKGAVMNGQSRNTIDDFKKKIDYDSIVKAVDGNKSIVFQNVHPENWSIISSLGQKPAVDEVTVRESGISREWIYKQNEAMLIIEMFISATNHKVAMNRLLNDASATTMLVIPFKKCPYNLGDINVSIIDEDFYRILWTHYNVYYSVKYTGKGLDVEKLCREIQNDSTHFIVNDIEKYRPQFKEVIISSNQIKKDEMVSIQILPAYGEAFKDQKKNSNINLSLTKNWKADLLDLVDYTDFSFKFRGIAEGTETITFILADLDALVCSKHEVTITVSK